MARKKAVATQRGAQATKSNPAKTKSVRKPGRAKPVPPPGPGPRDPVEQALLEAIAQAPEGDDGPHLAYADWLEEHGRIQGPFIRAGCAVDALPAYEQTPAMQHREWSYYDAYHHEWDLGLQEILKQDKRKNSEIVTYRRGVVHEARVSWKLFILHAQEIFEAAPTLKSIDSDWSASSLDPLLEQKILPRLGTLVINDVVHSRQALPKFLASGQLTGLKSLSIEYAEDAAGLATSLARCESLRNLESLDLSGFSLGTGDMQAILSSPYLTRLEDLHLAEPSLQDLEQLVRSPRAARLRSLKISDSDDSFSEDHARVLAHAERLSGLRSLALPSSLRGAIPREIARSTELNELRNLEFENVDLDDEAIRTLADSPVLSKLVKLELHHTGSDAAAEAIARSPYLNQLNYLAIGDAGLTAVGAAALAQAPNLASLRTLHLCGTRIGKQGAEAIARSPYLEGLEALHFNSSQIRAAAFAALAAGAYAPHLVEFAVPSNALSGRAIQQLVRAGLPNLRRLDLSACSIGSAGAQALAVATTLPKLASLDVANNKLDRADVDALLEAPGFRIDRIACHDVPRLQQLKKKYPHRVE